MGDSRKKQPDLLTSLLTSWPTELAHRVTLEVGLSGGLDSVVLLDLLWRCRERRHFQLTAVHVHHGLSIHADAWTEHCQRLCQERQIALRIEYVNVNQAGGESLEATARSVRYQAFSRSEASAVVLAHHLDDQVETVLLQLLRGGGPHGLAAMPPLRQLNALWIWRPLLNWPRDELETYALTRGLCWVNDESNADTRWRRNLLRHKVFPLVASSLPDYRQHIQRSAWMMGQAAQILDEVAQQDLDACLQQGCLLLAPLRLLSVPRQRQVLACWLKRLKALVSPDALEDFRQQALAADTDRHPQLQAAALKLFRYRDRIWVVQHHSVPIPSYQRLSDIYPDNRELACIGGRLEFVAHKQGVSRALLQQGAELRLRTGGERLYLEVGHKLVKTLLQEAGIPPLLRQVWPLLYLSDGRLAAVPSVAVALDCRGEDGVWPIWKGA